MSDLSGPSPAGAGLTLVATMMLRRGAALAIGALTGPPAPPALTGFSSGPVVGFAVVYARCRDI